MKRNQKTKTVAEPATGTLSATTISVPLKSAELRQIVTTLFLLLMERKKPEPFNRGEFCSLLKKIDVEKLYLKEENSEGNRRFTDFESFIEWLAEEARKQLRAYANGSNRILKNGYKLIQAYVIYNRLADKIADKNLPTQTTVLLAFIHCPVSDQVAVCRKILVAANGARITVAHVLDGIRAHGVEDAPEPLPSNSSRLSDVKAFLPRMESEMARYPELKGIVETLKEIVQGNLRYRDVGVGVDTGAKTSTSAGTSTPTPPAADVLDYQQIHEGASCSSENEGPQSAGQHEPASTSDESAFVEDSPTPPEIQADIVRADDIASQNPKPEETPQAGADTPSTQGLPHQQGQTSDEKPASEQIEKPVIEGRLAVEKKVVKIVFRAKDNLGAEILKKAKQKLKSRLWKNGWETIRVVKPGCKPQKEYLQDTNVLESFGAAVISLPNPAGTPVEFSLGC